MDNTTRSMAKHGMVDTIFLTEERLVVFAFLDIVDLHGMITLRSKKLTAFVVKIQ